MTTYIATVGTSIITNRDERPWAGWSKKTPLPEIDAIRDWALAQHPDIISAEINTLSRLGVTEGDKIVLLHSQTPEGELCAQAVGMICEKKWGAKYDLKLVANLDYEGGNRAHQGLLQLSHLLVSTIRDSRKDGVPVKLCATGGFKIEIAFSNLIALLHGVEVYYIHEQSRELVRLPSLPIRENPDFFHQHEELLEWLDAEPRTRAEAHSRLMANPAVEELVEYSEDGHVYLNAAADLLLKHHRATNSTHPIAWPAESTRLPTEKNKVSSEEHHRPHGWKSLLRDLLNHPYVDLVRYTAYKLGATVIERAVPELQVNLTDGKESMGFLVTTTATNPEQLSRIARHIRNTIMPRL